MRTTAERRIRREIFPFIVAWIGISRSWVISVLDTRCRRRECRTIKRTLLTRLGGEDVVANYASEAGICNDDFYY